MSVVAQLQAGGGEVVDITLVIEKFAVRIRCDADVLRAILQVESGGDDYDDQGRLIILPEKHIFHRKLPKGLRNKALALGLSARKWKRTNYKGLGGKGSNRRWALLARWSKLNEKAALLSASYAAPQIMGFNHKICGYDSVSDFVLALSQDSAASAEAFLMFLENSGLADELRDKDWAAIARRYNGSGQVTKYSGMMRRAYTKLKAGSQPGKASGKAKSPARFSMLRLGSEGYRVEALQKRLNELNYTVQTDGDFGPATRRAVVAFQVDHSLKPDGIVGPETEKALDVAVPINQQLGGGRDQLRVKDLRKNGSQTVKKADWLTRLGQILTGGGASAITLDQASNGGLLDGLGQVSSLLQSLRDQVQPVLSMIGDNKWMLLVCVGMAVILIASQIKQRRLQDAQNWRHVG
ncbi:MAG: N-acetylmuramidase domain-containing protein [Cohaesibacter sp.]|jgi:hypothetical protein|nr:N-acetylmuramidase domain-containing protein [Cohaesibacter sp.]